MKRLLLAPTLAFFLVSCGGDDAATIEGGSETSTTADASTTSVAVTSATTQTTATPTTSQAATTTSGAGVGCPEATSPSEGWRFLSTPLWTIYHPADWEDLSASAPPQTAGVHFDADTVANAGIDGSTELGAFVLTSPDRSQAVIFTQLDGITDSLEEIYQRAEDRYEAAASFEEMVDPAVVACLGGEPAMYAGFFNQGAYQQSWFALTNGTLFHADFFGATSDDAAINSELFATLSWNESAAEVSPGPFLDVEMANNIDTSASAPDPAWYTDTFTTSDSVIYAVFRLEEGTSGQVGAVWTYEDEQVVLTHEFFYDEADQWGYMGMTAPAGGFTSGNYQLELTLDGDAARVLLDFSITE